MAKWMPHWFVVTLANGNKFGTWAKDKNGAESRWDEPVAETRRATKAESEACEAVKVQYMAQHPNAMADEYNRHNMNVVHAHTRATERSWGK